ncbi:hypothetical protein Btru_069430 [Bulinus truncatus]|nr:hypothetical protein Btru_069430 [Bulinus truncatus]
MQRLAGIMENGKDLPSITLSKTTIPYLVTLIPVLVSMTSKREPLSYSDEACKPAWWPDDIKWRHPRFYMINQDKDSLKVLRKLVFSCYSYHGLEDLLSRLDESPVSETELETQDGSDVILITDDAEDGPSESSAESEGPVFVCCFCLEQFNSHDTVQFHQNICQNRYQDMDSSCSDKQQSYTLHNSSKSDAVQRLDVVSKSNKPTSQNSPSAFKNSHISKLDDDFLQQPKTPALEQVTSLPPKKPVTSIPFTFVPILKTRSQKKLDQIMEKHNQKRLMMKECQAMRSVPATGAWWKSKRRKASETITHPSCYLSAGAYLSALGLVKKTELESKVNDTAKQDVDMDCEIISVEGPLSAVPFQKTSSTSPRSTRSLMSQLSKDDEGNSRRRLSFCFVEDEWADKEALEEGRDPLQLSLLTLDLSSPLGQRIKKYVKGEGHLNIIKDAENYCRTEVDEDGYSKLRYRVNDFRVTFKKKKRASTFVHKYKFNHSDRLEFKMLIKSGLSARSRLLKQCLPTCKVVLKRLKISEIKEWTEEKKISIPENIIYDDDICITQIDIPQSKITRFPTERNGSDTQTQSPSKIPSQFLQNLPSKPKLPTSRPALTHHLPPSPPHVPNILRNRSPYSPSPTRPGPKSAKSQAAHKFSKALDFSQVYCASSMKTPVPVLKNIDNAHHKHGENFMSHLSKHPPQSPSVYSSVHSLPAMQKKLAGPSSRRKQQMTYVRRDDFDGGLPRHNGDQNFGFIHLSGNDTCVVSNSSGNFQDSNNGNIPNIRKLSNFDYFSIRNGKLHHPHLPHVAPNLYGPNKPQLTTPQKSHSALNSSHAITPASSRPQPKHLHRNGYDGSAINSQKSSIPIPKVATLPSTVKQQVSSSLMDHLASTVSIPDASSHHKSFMSTYPALGGEDEILEIICIDDD